jgi:magnesium transporter
MTFTIDKDVGLQSLIGRDFLTVSEWKTVGNITSQLKELRRDFQNKFAYIYVINEAQKLKGVLRVRDLLIEDEAARISALMTREVFSIPETASLEEALQVFQAHSFPVLPVTDRRGQLVGVISSDRLEKWMTPEMKRRFSRSAGAEEEVERQQIHEMVFKRLPWLFISVTSGLACAYILGIFIGRIESIVALILFVPIVLGIAGNVGTQSARIASRDLDDNRLSIVNVGKVTAKEALFGLILGGMAFLNSFLIALLWKKSPVEGFALGVSIVAIAAVSALLGHLLPVVFRVLRVHSRAVSGLFILLICDMVALILYFTISLALVNPGLELT